MRRIFALILVMLSLVMCVSCGDDQPSDENFLDLTSMSDTMVAVQMENMVNFPNQFVGKTVKMTGKWKISLQNANSYSCVFYDETGCCPYPLNIKLADGQSVPQDGKLVTVQGDFELDTSGVKQQVRLINSVVFD